MVGQGGDLRRPTGRTQIVHRERDEQVAGWSQLNSSFRVGAVEDIRDDDPSIVHRPSSIVHRPCAVEKSGAFCIRNPRNLISYRTDSEQNGPAAAVLRRAVYGRRRARSDAEHGGDPRGAGDSLGDIQHGTCLSRFRSDGRRTTTTTTTRLLCLTRSLPPPPPSRL